MKNASSFKTPGFLTKVLLIGVLLTGCDKTSEVASAPEPAAHKEKVELMHVHGLVYSPDGKKLLIPSHHGLAAFDGSTWIKAAGPQHDYMGFSATKDAIYSSGHPAPDSGQVNPFGVIKSTDGGQTWQKLGMEGESDFHLLATGYGTNAVYVVNHQPNSKMKQPGIYYTLNDGFAWQRASAQGLNAEPASLAVHPSDPKTIAVATENGLYFSQSAGNSFQRIGEGTISAVFFELGGTHLWFSRANAHPSLVRFDWLAKETSEVALPEMNNDAVAYIAQNPARRNEFAVATFRRSVYVSQDEGKTWQRIAEAGKTH